MLNYRDTQNALHTRLVDFSLQEYLFVLQTVLGEEPCVAYSSVFDWQNFKRNVPSENEDEYLAKFKQDASILLSQQQCVHMKEYLEQEYRSEIQAAASNLEDFKYTSSDVQKLLNNLLHDRAETLSEASIRDIVSLIKSMYESGALDSGDSFQSHFIVVPSKYNTICPSCNREGSAVEGMDFRCEFCGHVAKWDESQRRYFPNLGHL